jgi:hypothetical protein
VRILLAQVMRVMGKLHVKALATRVVLISINNYMTKKLLSHIQNIIKHPSFWVRTIALAFVVFLLFFVLLFFIMFLLPLSEILYEGDLLIPTLHAFVSITLFVYVILLILWFIFSKNKSLIKFIHDAIPFLFTGAILYFWCEAGVWESRLAKNWSGIPELSNLSAILEYTKALVKTAMLSSITLIFWLWFKKKRKDL